MSEIKQLLDKVRTKPETVQFGEVLDVIEEFYQYRPTAFKNGDTENSEGQNEGSCKLFTFAMIHQLDEKDTLNLFGDYYRKDVLESPDGIDHQNIRNFMKYGWEGISFESTALYER
ncbi:MAG: HopJ type III effector protein [Bacteroidota bacterium]